MPSVEFSDSYRIVSFGYPTNYIRVNYSEVEYDVTNNRTKVRLDGVYIKYTGAAANSRCFGTLKFNGTTVLTMSGSPYTLTVDSSYTYIPNTDNGATVWVQHNTTGAATLTISLNGGTRNDDADDVFGALYYYGSGYPVVGVRTPATKSVSLTTRPRISSVSATNAYFGEDVTITLNRYNSGFTHTVKVTCAGNTETLMTQGTTYPTLTWTPALATYAPLITNAMSATATITCETYNGSTLIGTSTTTCTLTFKAADVAPSVSIAVSDPTGCLTTYGKFIKSKSKITVTLTNTFAFGATLSTTQITANGATYNESPATTDFVLSADNTSITARIVDSRGQVATASITIEIYDYTAPQINSLAVHRCKADGTDDNTGAYFAVNYSITVTPLGNVNSKTLTAKYKKQSAQSYSSQNIPLASYSETSVSAPIAADTNATYNVRIELADDFGTTVFELKLPTASTRMNWGAGVNGGIAIGKVSEYDKTLEIADGWHIKGQGFFDAVYPIGSIYMSINSTDPSTLFGGTWEQLEDRFLLAAGSEYAAGTTGGKSSYVAADMPKHSHTRGTMNITGQWRINADNSNAGMDAQCSGSGAISAFQVTGAGCYGDGKGWSLAGGFNFNAANAWTGSTSEVGTNDTATIMPPYLAVYMWKRTA